MAIRIIFFLLGFIFLCFGSSLYMTADMGVSTYDAIALICSRQWNMGAFRIVRVATDFLCILIGISLFQLCKGSSVVPFHVDRPHIVHRSNSASGTGRHRCIGIIHLLQLQPGAGWILLLGLLDFVSF